LKATRYGVGVVGVLLLLLAVWQIQAAAQGLEITVDNAIAEGDYVAVEGRSYGETAIGKIYQNRYHWLFEVRDGKVRINCCF